MPTNIIRDVLDLIDLHYGAFFDAKPFADKTDHPTPCDTRAWSQILVSLLTNIKGLKRKKGADLVDGSDVKAANCWSAIDTPRFNGAIPSGRVSTKAKKANDVSALDGTPYIFFVLWDETPEDGACRCRVWCVRPQKDRVFRSIARRWHGLRESGEITSTNFQLHPPRNKNGDQIRNECGNFKAPLLFCAVQNNGRFEQVEHNPAVLESGECKLTLDS